MMNLHSETNIRLLAFMAILVIMLVFETLFPRKRRTQDRLKHILNNLGIVLSYTVLLQIVFRLVPIGAAMGMAAYAQAKGWGVLNLFDMPIWLSVTISVILLDMAVYWQHVASHKIPIIWDFHKMHHADRDLDATSGIRFHPVEILASMFYKMAVVVLLGPPVLGVFLFEVILNGAAMFNHANVKLPLWFDKILRLFIVTPDFHRVHHSIYRHETDSNYGFNLSIWDRVFGSYIAQPQDGHENMKLGLPQYQTDAPTNMLWCLKLPFMKQRKVTINPEKS